MIRRFLFFSLLCSTLFQACRKTAPHSIQCLAFASYTDTEQPIAVEETYGNWEGHTGTLIAEGTDHEQLKLYLPGIYDTGTRTLNATNISFSDGLDFESTQVSAGQVTITSVSEEMLEGTFRATLLDHVNGRESRRLEGSFRLQKQ
ncbi:MAG: hypothetical protein JNL72_08670 [Flavipsychrobacter sp.]|nr:hypothetical protein [Flavipsychrobacter sp.]